MDSKKIEIRPCPTYRSTGQDSCRRPDRVIVAEQTSIKPAYIPIVNIYHPIKLRSIVPDITLSPIQESNKILIVDLIVDPISK